MFGDIENLPNLLNHNWGGVTQVGFPQTATAVNVQCLAVATANGTAAVANTASNQVCTQYRYTQAQAPAELTTSSVSLYLIRVGARFKF